MRQASLFDGARMRLQDAIDLSIDSLNAYGERHEHWATAYSGGKDSSATVTFLAWAIREGLVVRPKTWPNGWEGDEIRGDVPIDSVIVTDGGVVTQPLLV